MANAGNKDEESFWRVGLGVISSKFGHFEGLWMKRCEEESNCCRIKRNKSR